LDMETKIDYTDIILKGISDPVTKGYFADYLFREFQNANGDGYSIGEFLTGCRSVLVTLLSEWEKEHVQMLNLLYLNEGFEKIAVENASVNLHIFTKQKYTGFVNYSDIELIRNSIDNLGKRVTEVEVPTQVFVPLVNEDAIEGLYVSVCDYFEPKEQLMNFITRKPITGKINFIGTQAKLAGIFIYLRYIKEATFGTHEQTYNFIKNTFLVNGEPITSKQILRYLEGKTKINDSSSIEIKI